MGNSPNWSYGFVPTTAQWNEAFAAKQDDLGFTPVNRAGDTMLGKLTAWASSAQGAGFAILPGTDPDDPKDGDVWISPLGLFFQVNGETVGPILHGTVVGPNASVIGNVPLWGDTDGSILTDSGKSLPDGDIVGTTDHQSLSDKAVVLQASEAAGAKLTITPGAAVTSPNNGDTWLTSFGLFYRANGVTIGPVSNGNIVGPTPPTTAGNIATYADTSGRTLADGGKGLPSGAIVGATDTQTLTNKTLTSPVLNTQVTGTAIADQTAMEAASSTSVIVTPGRQKFHPCAAKGWVFCGVSGNILASYNVSSVTDSTIGEAIVNWSTAFSSGNYAAITSVTAGSGCAGSTGNQSATFVGMRSWNVSASGSLNTLVDPTSYSLVAFGDQ